MSWDILFYAAPTPPPSVEGMPGDSWAEVIGSAGEVWRKILEIGSLRWLSGQSKFEHMFIDLGKVLALPVEERIELAQSIRDSVAAVPEAAPLTEEQRLELEGRPREYRQNPDSGSPWPEVRDRLIVKP